MEPKLIPDNEQSQQLTNPVKTHRRKMLKDAIRACDMCQKRKTRCIMDGQVCEACIKRKSPCCFKSPILKRGPKGKRKPKVAPENGDEVHSNSSVKEKGVKAKKKLAKNLNNLEIDTSQSFEVQDQQETESIVPNTLLLPNTPLARIEHLLLQFVSLGQLKEMDVGFIIDYFINIHPFIIEQTILQNLDLHPNEMISVENLCYYLRTTDNIQPFMDLFNAMCALSSFNQLLMKHKYYVNDSESRCNGSSDVTPPSSPTNLSFGSNEFIFTPKACMLLEMSDFLNYYNMASIGLARFPQQPNSMYATFSTIMDHVFLLTNPLNSGF